MYITADAVILGGGSPEPSKFVSGFALHENCSLSIIHSNNTMSSKSRSSRRSSQRQQKRTQRQEKQAKKVMIGIGIAAVVLIILSFVVYSLY